MIIQLIDGTYELFRHFYGQRCFNKGKDKPFVAVVGVLHGVLEMIEKDAMHIGVATDPSGKKHNLQNHDIIIINASNAELLPNKKRMTEVVRKLNPFSSEKKKGIVYESTIERDQIIYDLKNIEPIGDYRLQLTSDYGISIVNNKASLSMVEKTVIRNVISENTKEVSYRIRKRKGKTEERKMQIVPKHHEIEIKRKSLIYVPK